MPKWSSRVERSSRLQEFGLALQVLHEFTAQLRIAILWKIAWFGKADLLLELRPNGGRLAGLPGERDGERRPHVLGVFKEWPVDRVRVRQHGLAQLHIEKQPGPPLGELSGLRSTAGEDQIADREGLQVEVFQGHTLDVIVARLVSDAENSAQAFPLDHQDQRARRSIKAEWLPAGRVGQIPAVVQAAAG